MKWYLGCDFSGDHSAIEIGDILQFCGGDNAPKRKTKKKHHKAILDLSNCYWLCY